jgi:hypothetical protein
MQERRGCTARAHNPRYVSSRTLLDASRSPLRFIPPASIECWRERMRCDVRMRSALLNPVRHEPGGG